MRYETTLSLLGCLTLALCSASAHADSKKCLSNDDCPTGNVCYRAGSGTQCADDLDGGDCAETNDAAAQPGFCREQGTVQPGTAKGGGSPGAGSDASVTPAKSEDSSCSVRPGRASAPMWSVGLLGTSLLVLARRRRAVRRRHA